jgi:DNA-binding winged helix-turn-helix (wHTH) protein
MYADFAGKWYPWMIFQKLCKSYPSSILGEDLLNSVWEQGEGSLGTLQAHMTTVREIIRPLGLTVTCVRNVGYKLLDQHVAGTDAG